MIKPVGFYILVRPDPPKEALNNDLIYIPETVTDQHRLAMDTGTLLAVGDCAWKGIEGNRDKPWAQVGDHIIYAKYGGKILEDKERGEKVILLHDKDVIGVL